MSFNLLFTYKDTQIITDSNSDDKVGCQYLKN